MDPTLIALTQSAITSVIGPSTIALLSYVIWRLQKTDKKVEAAAIVSQEVKREVKNSHPVSLRTDLDSKFDRLYTRMDERDAAVDIRMDEQDERLKHIDDNQTIHELQMRAVTNVISTVKTALEDSFKTDS